MIYLAIDKSDQYLRAKHISKRNIAPDLTYTIEGEDVQVWIDVSGVELDEIEELVWVTVMAALG